MSFVFTIPLLYNRRLLKRNASERIEFRSFFNHPFVTKYSRPKMSSPVKVPRNSDKHADIASTDDSTSTGSIHAISVSPLSTPSIAVASPASLTRRDQPSNIPHQKDEVTPNYVIILCLFRVNVVAGRLLNAYIYHHHVCHCSHHICKMGLCYFEEKLDFFLIYCCVDNNNNNIDFSVLYFSTKFINCCCLK